MDGLQNFKKTCAYGGDGKYVDSVKLTKNSNCVVLDWDAPAKGMGAPLEPNLKICDDGNVCDYYKYFKPRTYKAKEYYKVIQES